MHFFKDIKSLAAGRQRHVFPRGVYKQSPKIEEKLVLEFPTEKILQWDAQIFNLWLKTRLGNHEFSHKTRFDIKYLTLLLMQNIWETIRRLNQALI